MRIKTNIFILIQKRFEAKWYRIESFLKFRQEYMLPKKASGELIGDLLVRLPYRKLSNIKMYFLKYFFKFKSKMKKETEKLQVVLSLNKLPSKKVTMMDNVSQNK